MYGAMFDKDVAGETTSLDKFLHLVSSAGRRNSDVELNALRTPSAKTAAERIVLYMTQLGMCHLIRFILCCNVTSSEIT